MQLSKCRVEAFWTFAECLRFPGGQKMYIKLHLLIFSLALHYFFYSIVKQWFYMHILRFYSLPLQPARFKQNGTISRIAREKSLPPHAVHMWNFVHDVRCKPSLKPPSWSSLTKLQYDAGVLGGVLFHKPFLDAIGNPTGVYIIPMISSSYSLAACVMSFFVGFIAFRLGRRGTIILGCVLAVLGSIIQSTSNSVAQLIVGRIITVCEDGVICCGEMLTF